MKTILHLCADTGSDSWPYREAGYNVILVGSDIGVENFNPPEDVYGIFANPVCTEFSTARSNGKARDPEAGMFLVKECQRIIEMAKPKFWVIENPAKGVLKEYLGQPVYEYEPWWYGSPWTKRTALWGNFNIPERESTLIGKMYQSLKVCIHGLEDQSQDLLSCISLTTTVFQNSSIYLYRKVIWNSGPCVARSLRKLFSK